VGSNPAIPTNVYAVKRLGLSLGRLCLGVLHQRTDSDDQRAMEESDD
jgi:hypothetical protein